MADAEVILPQIELPEGADLSPEAIYEALIAAEVERGTKDL